MVNSRVMALHPFFPTLLWQNGTISVNLFSALHNYVHWSLCSVVSVRQRGMRIDHWQLIRMLKYSVRFNYLIPCYEKVGTINILYLRTPPTNMIVQNRPNSCSTVFCSLLKQLDATRVAYIYNTNSPEILFFLLIRWWSWREKFYKDQKFLELAI